MSSPRRFKHFDAALERFISSRHALGRASRLDEYYADCELTSCAPGAAT
jgi:hypothetical protein